MCSTKLAPPCQRRTYVQPLPDETAIFEPDVAAYGVSEIVELPNRVAKILCVLCRNCTGESETALSPGQEGISAKYFATVALQSNSR